TLCGKPAFQLAAGRAARPRSAEEVTQTVGAHGNFSRHAPQREPRDLPRDRILQQRNRQRRHRWSAAGHAPLRGRARRATATPSAATRRTPAPRTVRTASAVLEDAVVLEDFACSL